MQIFPLPPPTRASEFQISIHRPPGQSQFKYIELYSSIQPFYRSRGQIRRHICPLVRPQFLPTNPSTRISCVCVCVCVCVYATWTSAVMHAPFVSATLTSLTLVHTPKIPTTTTPKRTLLKLNPHAAVGESHGPRRL